MAANKTFLDLEGLAQYDKLVKGYIDDEVTSEETRAKAAEEQLLAAINEVAGGSTKESEENAEAIDVLNGDATVQGSVKQQISSAIDEVNSSVEANTDAIEVLNGDENTEGSVQKQISDAVAEVNSSVEANTDAIEVLNGDENTEGSVKQQVKTAIAEVVDSAPETLDTLKEIADWIESDETGTKNLTQTVAQNSKDVAQNTSDIEDLQNKTSDLKSYVDAQDLNYYNSITSIAELNIKALFMTKKEITEGQTVSDAIAALDTEKEMLVLNENSEISEDITVPSGAVIDANGSTFSGNLNVASDAIISNAVFTGTVTIA